MLNPARSQAARARLASIVTLLLTGAALASCSRTLPTAPAGRAGAPSRSLSAQLQAEMLNDVVVLLTRGTKAEQIVADHGGTLIYDWYSCARIAPPAGTTCDEFVAELQTDGRVLTAEQNAVLETAESRQESFASDDGLGSDRTFAEQPAAESVGITEAHRVSLGEFVKVAVLDTGVDPSHPALYGHLGAGYDVIGRDNDATDAPNGVDDDGDGTADEAYGHGTHVAGIVALTAPRAIIQPVRVLDSDGRGNVCTVSVGLLWALYHGARVINLSLGMLHYSPAIQRLLDEADRRHIVVVCSAGNWGSEFPREYPAANDRAVAIGASDASAHPAPFTSYGTHLRVLAPGVGVRSAFPGGGYRLWSGTSMSSPFVAGTAALLLYIHPGWGEQEVLQRIGATAQPLSCVSPSQSGKLGDGALDAGAALAPDLSPLAGTADPPAPDADPGDVRR